MTGVDETAKAIQEVAKASGKAIDAAVSTGGFFAEFIRAPLQERVGILTDNLKFRRWENMLELRRKAVEKLRLLGSDAEIRQIPMAVGVPLLEAATLVETDDLRSLWANLLVNYANGKSGITIQKSFVSVLSELSPLEAIILEKIYSVAGTTVATAGILTGRLPELADLEVTGGVTDSSQPEAPQRDDVNLALSNLLRLGCIGPATTWDGGELLGVVYPTTFGRALINACTLQHAE